MPGVRMHAKARASLSVRQRPSLLTCNATVCLAPKGELRGIRDLRQREISELLGDRMPAAEAATFARFLLPMLEFDPLKRATACQMLQHEWLTADGAEQTSDGGATPGGAPAAEAASAPAAATGSAVGATVAGGAAVAVDAHPTRAVPPPQQQQQPAHLAAPIDLDLD